MLRSGTETQKTNYSRAIHRYEARWVRGTRCEIGEYNGIGLSFISDAPVLSRFSIVTRLSLVKYFPARFHPRDAICIKYRLCRLLLIGLRARFTVSRVSLEDRRV